MSALEPLELLHDLGAAVPYQMPAALAELYPGILGFPEDTIYANFVSSLDGVVSLDGSRSVGRLLSGDAAHDRLVMGLLRAAAEAVLIGAGTLRASPRSAWTPAAAFPDLAPEFAALRRGLGRTEVPRLAVITRTGRLDPDHPGLGVRPLILTSAEGRRRIPAALAARSEVLALGVGGVDLERVAPALRERGLRVVLSEAGPGVTGQLLRDGLLGEMFLTLSPLVAGGGGPGRQGMAGAVELLPTLVRSGTLAGVRRWRNHLFLHYRFGAG